MFDCLSKKITFCKIAQPFFILFVITLTAIIARADVNPFPVTTVSAASYEKAAVTSGSLVSAFGTKLATTTTTATDIDLSTPVIELPTNLSGTTVQINGQLAGLLFVSPTQVNFIIPTGIVEGTATVKITAGDGTESNGTIEIARVSPAIFTLNANGEGVLAAEVVRVKANGTQVRETLAQRDPVTNQMVTKPIDLGQVGERVFLEIYLTGIRGAADDNADGNLNENVWVLIGGQSLTPSFAGRQPFFAGLDQVNVELPRSLLGSGKINLSIHARIGSCFACRSTPGVTARLVELEIANPAGTTPPVITNLSLTQAAVGNLVTISGSGFAASVTEQTVKIGGVKAAIESANSSQLVVKVPPGAITGVVTVRTAAGEARSATELAIKTSVTGVVETADAENSLSPAPLANLTVKIAGTAISTTTNASGFFTLPDVPSGDVTIEVDPVSFALPNAFTKISLPFKVQAGRDNVLPSTIWLTKTGKLDATESTGGAAVVGLLTEKDGATPIANALVRLTKFSNGVISQPTTITDASGSYIFRNLPSGQYILSATSFRPDGTITSWIGVANVTTTTGVANSPVKIDLSLKDVANRRPFLLAPTALAMNTGETLDVPMYASDFDSGNVFTVSVSGPSGISITAGANGLFTMRLRPTASGNFKVTVTVKDNLDAQTVQEISLAVTGANIAPTVTVPGARTIGVGQTLSFNVTANDPDAGQTISLVATNMPQGATFTPAAPVGTLTGTFSWTPAANQVGTYTVTFTATDNGTPALSEAKTVTITVTAQAQEDKWLRAANGGLPVGKYIEQVIAKGTNLWGKISGYGVYVSSDGGNTWTAKNNGLANLNLDSIDVIGVSLIATTRTAPTSDGISYLTNIFVSDNDGVSWRSTNTNIASMNLVQLNIAGEKLYASNSTPMGTVILISNNLGMTWDKLSISEPLPLIGWMVTGEKIFRSQFDRVAYWNGMIWVERLNTTFNLRYTVFATDGLTFHALKRNGEVDIFLDNITSPQWISGGAGLPSGTLIAGQVVRLFVQGSDVMALHNSLTNNLYVSTDTGRSYLSFGFLNDVLNVAFSGKVVYAATSSGIYSRRLP